MATSTVAYPAGAKFDMSYYLATHMPLVSEKWTPYGLKSWKIVEHADDAPYKVVATLEWDDMEDYQKAKASDAAKEVMGDIKNFCDKSPAVYSGKVVGRG